MVTKWKHFIIANTLPLRNDVISAPSVFVWRKIHQNSISFEKVLFSRLKNVRAIAQPSETTEKSEEI